MLITEHPQTSTDNPRRKARVIPILQEDAYSDWSSTFERDSSANPFQHPDYVLAELDRNVSPSGLKPVLLRVGTEASCDGIGILVPKSVTTNQVGGIGPGWKINGYRLVGGDFLIPDPSIIEIQKQLLSSVVRQCTEAGAEFLVIEDLDEQSQLSKLIQNGAAKGFSLFAARDIQPRWRIEFPSDAEDYWKTFTSRTRSKFRARLKKFGQSHLERITEVDQVSAFLKAANEVSAQSWQTRQFGLRIRNSETEHRQLSILAERGFLRSYVWQVQGQPAAFALCHQRADYFRYEEIAYRAEYSLLSPGVTLLQQIIEDLYRHELPKTFDFGGGDAEYKQKFGNRESRSQTLWLVPPTWRAGATLAYLNTCRGIRSTGRRVVKSSGLATKARQWLRYGGRPAPSQTETLETADRGASEEAGR